MKEGVIVMSVDDALVMILAGGEGKRLYPLTKDRAKPAVPFGGRYRIIDFVLNNFINSGFFKIKVLTQYKSDSLNKHITRGWALSPFLNQYVDLAPAQMRTGSDWYRGTADAIYQNVFHITDEDPDYVCIFGGDHIYKMDVSQMLDYHKEKNADLSISAIPIPISEAHEFGIIEVDDDWRLINFVEKPKDMPKSIPGNPDMCLASMGNYIFNKNVLLDALNRDEEIQDSSHDFGKNVIPMLLKEGKKCEEKKRPGDCHFVERCSRFCWFYLYPYLPPRQLSYLKNYHRMAFGHYCGPPTYATRTGRLESKHRCGHDVLPYQGVTRF